MKIIFLTQYFPPEVGAPQNRLYELAKSLKEKGWDVSVLTAMPNYPDMKIQENYKGKLYCSENNNGIQIYRAWIYAKKTKNLFLRLINYFSFVFTSFIVGLFKLKRSDYILCESPPLFLGISSFLLCRLKGAKQIFNVSDLMPESAERLGIITNKFLLNASRRLEEFLYKESEIITGQTQGIIYNISARMNNKKVYWLPNGVSEELLKINPVKNVSLKNSFGLNENDITVYYGGILGIPQGLEVILYAADLLKNVNNLKFLFVGNGPEKENLLKIQSEKKLYNVIFVPTQPKDKMPEIISCIDMAIIPLKRLDIFKGAIPSKIFEVLALEKPVLLGVEGEAYEYFINQGKCGLPYIPENFEDLAKKIMELYSSEDLRIKLGRNGRNYVNQFFNRDTISDNFHKYLLSLN